MSREFSCNYKGELHFSWYCLEGKNVKNGISNCYEMVVQEAEAGEVWFWQVLYCLGNEISHVPGELLSCFWWKSHILLQWQGKWESATLTAKWHIFTWVLLPRETKGWRKLLLRIKERWMICVYCICCFSCVIITEETVKPHCSLCPRQAVRKRVVEKRGEDFKKEGKIYRLRTQDDGEDENNTWNGNSTQQM